MHLPSIFESNPKKGVGFGYGEKAIIPKHMLNNAKYLPGPGSYFKNVTQVDQKPAQDKPTKGFTFGVSREFYKKVYIPSMKANDPEVAKELPGPNQYQQLHEFGKSKQKFTISTKSKQSQQKYPVPAANYYEVKYDLTQPRRYNGIGFGYGTRDQNSQKKSLSPGPGAYKQSSLFDKFEKQAKLQPLKK